MTEQINGLQKEFAIQDKSHQNITLRFQDHSVTLLYNQSQETKVIPKSHFIGVTRPEEGKAQLTFAEEKVEKGITSYEFHILEIHSEQKSLEEIRDLSMELLYQGSEFKRKEGYYKRILLFVNPNSGKKKAKLIFEQSITVFESNGIKVDHVFTEPLPFVMNYLTQLDREVLLSYDMVGSISGDGTSFEIINAIKSRADIQHDNMLTLFQIPSGSGCAIIESCICIPQKKANNYKTALFAICKTERTKMPLMEVKCLKQDGEVVKFYSIVGINYGFIADIDINSEFLRFLGDARFEVYSYFKVLLPNVYNAELVLPKEENQELPEIGEEVAADDLRFEVFREGIYTFYSSVLPSVLQKGISSPDLLNNMGKINIHWVPKQLGKIHFIKYMLQFQNVDLNSEKKYLYKTIKSFRLKLDPAPKRKNIVIDGESKDKHKFVSIQCRISEDGYYSLK